MAGITKNGNIFIAAPPSKNKKKEKKINILAKML